ncbi:MAG: Hint domain-containing protein, partial [Gemmataceae bacterium]
MFGQSLTGQTRYQLVQRFEDVSNAAGGAAPGHVKFRSHGLPFRDPEWKVKNTKDIEAMLLAKDEEVYKWYIKKKGQAWQPADSVEFGQLRVIPGIGQFWKFQVGSMNRMQVRDDSAAGDTNLILEYNHEVTAEEVADRIIKEARGGYFKRDFDRWVKWRMDHPDAGDVMREEYKKWQDATQAELKSLQGMVGSTLTMLYLAPTGSIGGGLELIARVADGGKLEPADLLLLAGVLGKLPPPKIPLRAGKAPPVPGGNKTIALVGKDGKVVYYSREEIETAIQNVKKAEANAQKEAANAKKVAEAKKSSPVETSKPKDQRKPPQFHSVDPKCFVAGTPLLTPDGWKPIEDFREGDLVLSRAETDPSGPLGAKAVDKVFVRVGPVVRLVVSGRVIETTAEHPFWVVGMGWRCAGELRPRDTLASHNEFVGTVDSVSESPTQVTLYNLRVADWHTYFVGCDEWGFSVWAHNADCAVLVQNGEKFTLKSAVDGRVLKEGGEVEVRAFARTNGHDINLEQVAGTLERETSHNILGSRITGGIPESHTPHHLIGVKEAGQSD